jgi:RES domain-containing protein
MDVFRICRKTYSPQDPSGAALSSEGRWHKKGQRVLYFSNSLATCVLELRSNGISYHTIRSFDHFAVAKIPASASMERVPEGFYKDGWQQAKIKSQKFGSKWYTQNRSLVLRVKSAVIAVEDNFIINTNHPEFSRVTFSNPKNTGLDPRLSEIEDADSRD